jgi:hypothetical protein
MAQTKEYLEKNPNIVSLSQSLPKEREIGERHWQRQIAIEMEKG